MSELYKFGWLPDGKSDEQYEYPDVWAKEKTSGPDRLVVAPSARHTQLLRELASCMQEPFLLLCVLAIPRGGSEPGRYQSRYSFTLTQLQQFLTSYSDFLESDGRHNLWVRSSGEETLVYDRHNVIFVYGSLDKFIPLLEASGLKVSDKILFPSPHAHHYHAEFDAYEKRILHDEEWIMSPLRPGDENPE